MLVRTKQAGRKASLETMILHFDLGMFSSGHVPCAKVEGVVNTQLEMWVWCSRTRSALEKQIWE